MVMTSVVQAEEYLYFEPYTKTPVGQTCYVPETLKIYTYDAVKKCTAPENDAAKLLFTTLKVGVQEECYEADKFGLGTGSFKLFCDKNSLKTQSYTEVGCLEDKKVPAGTAPIIDKSMTGTGKVDCECYNDQYCISLQQSGWVAKTQA